MTGRELIMKKLKLYLDTSVINFLFADDAPDLKEATQDFFANIDNYEIYISEVVIREIVKTSDESKRERLLDIVDQHRLIILEADRMEEIAKLAQCYLDEGVIPPVKREDAEHIAYAVIHEMDILVSWNYKHLANINKERKICIINQKQGYFYPFRMVTPLEVAKDE